MDVPASCIYAGSHNLSAAQFAAIVKRIRPRVAMSRHYDMMVNNAGASEIFRLALNGIGCDVACHVMNDDQPRLYRRSACSHARGLRKGMDGDFSQR